MGFVLLPSRLPMLKNPLRLLQKIIGHPSPKEFNFNCPIKKLKSYATQLNIPLVSLMKTMKEYRDRFNLPYPYFSYRCDEHYNPLGHCIVAASVARFLLENGFIPSSVIPYERQVKILKKAEEILSLPPQKILGEKAWRQIYEGGRYHGQSNVPQVLRLP